MLSIKFQKLAVKNLNGGLEMTVVYPLRKIFIQNCKLIVLKLKYLYVEKFLV